MKQLDVSEIKIGMRFSEPVYFDDGKNMFIASEISVKPYHLSAITKWNIPFLLTDGIVLAEGEHVVSIEEIENIDVEPVEEIEEIEEVSEFEEPDNNKFQEV